MERGTSICQLVPQNYRPWECRLVEEFNDEPTGRGERGDRCYGSSGHTEGRPLLGVSDDGTKKK